MQYLKFILTTPWWEFEWMMAASRERIAPADYVVWRKEGAYSEVQEAYREMLDMPVEDIFVIVLPYIKEMNK